MLNKLVRRVFGWPAHEEYEGMGNRKAPKVFEDLRRRWEANKNAVENSRDSRQQISARIRRETCAKINKDYGPEPRKARRGIALTLARKIRRGYIAGMREKNFEELNEKRAAEALGLEETNAVA